MSNSLKGLREEIALVLSNAGITTYGFIPERIAPPLAVIEPGSPYMEQGQTFVDFRFRFNVVLIAGPWQNQKATDDLDQMILNAVDALDAWYVERVETPQAFEINNAVYLGTKIAIVDERELKL